INLRSNSSLIHPAELFEPTEKRFAGGMREWSLQNRLSRSGCLSDDHDVAHDRAARNRRRLHPRAAPALQQLCDMSFWQLLPTCSRHRSTQKRCEDAPHSKSTSREIRQGDNPFREALGVRTRPRVAFSIATQLSAGISRKATTASSGQC